MPPSSCSVTVDSFAARSDAWARSCCLSVGLATERGLIRFYYSRPPEDQILVTFGLGIMMVEAVRYVFGGLSQRVPLPSWGQGIVNFGFFLYPLYRVEVIGIVAALLLAFYLLLYRTRIGLVVRAGIEDPLMVELLGTHVRRAFLVVFCLGAMAAGIAGVIYAPLAAVIPNMGEPFLVECFVVVVIGGLGSFPGAVVGGIVVGEILQSDHVVRSGLCAGGDLCRDDAGADRAAARPVRHDGAA